jgi:hypothetical protein
MVWMLINDCDAQLAKQSPLTVRAPFLEYRCYTNEKVVDMPKNRAQFTPMRTTAADSITILFITLDKNRTARSFVRPVRFLSSVIKSLVMLSAAVVRIGVNCARFFGMSTTFSLV